MQKAGGNYVPTHVPIIHPTYIVKTEGAVIAPTTLPLTYQLTCLPIAKSRLHQPEKEEKGVCPSQALETR